MRTRLINSTLALDKAEQWNGHPHVWYRRLICSYNRTVALYRNRKTRSAARYQTEISQGVQVCSMLAAAGCAVRALPGLQFRKWEAARSGQQVEWLGEPPGARS